MAKGNPWEAKEHPGFDAVSAGIAKKGKYNPAQADAILAASTRKAGAKAKKANPNLKKVKGK
jgi:hypothetical protein